MLGVDLAQEAQQNPAIAEVTFRAVEGAVNLVLPGNIAHERYNRVNEVGLALVIAADGAEPNGYNPFDPTTPERLAFATDNQDIRPGAWTPLEADPSILGGDMPTTMGRFSVFALGKINTLTTNRNASSFSAEGVSIAPGQVGFAGGNRLAGSLLAMSGLWEIHDHLVGKVYAHELLRNLDPEKTQTSAKDLEELVGSLVSEVTVLHAGSAAAKLQRTDLAELVTASDELLDRTLAA